SFVKLSQQSLGFSPAHLWVGLVATPQAQYPDVGARNRLAEKTQEIFKSVPGFENVTISGDFPLAGPNGNALYAFPEGDIPPVDKRLVAPNHDVAPGYFRCWGIPIIAGRDFDEHDVTETQQVMLISQSGARKLFGKQNPVGR